MLDAKNMTRDKHLVDAIFSLTETQHSLIVGSLLGDGAMRCKRNALLEINHCARQSEYVDWKFTILRNLVRTPPKLRKSNGGRVAYRFTTLSLPILKPYYELFYKDRSKVVPNLVLTPLALAVWFMDDGHKSHNAVYFNTQQFALGAQMRLLDILRKLSIEASINCDKSYYRIRVCVSSVQQLRSLVEPHLPPYFRYKFPTSSLE